MLNLERHLGIKIRGHNINNLKFTDSIVLIADKREDLQGSLNNKLSR